MAMTPARLRRALHTAHVIATLVLLATGFLVEWPELRARLIGGYGPQIARVHRWAGVAFIAAPALALLVAARPLMRDLLRRLGPPDPVNWRKIHIVTSLLLGVALSVSGVLLWVDAGLPLAALDATLTVHIVATWALAVSIPVHLAAARRKIVSRCREIVGLEAPPVLPGEDEGPEEELGKGPRA